MELAGEDAAPVLGEPPGGDAHRSLFRLWRPERDARGTPDGGTRADAASRHCRPTFRAGMTDVCTIVPKRLRRRPPCPEVDGVFNTPDGADGVASAERGIIAGEAGLAHQTGTLAHNKTEWLTTRA